MVLTGTPFIIIIIAGKCTAVIQTSGENINVCWSPDGNHIAVGDKVCVYWILKIVGKRGGQGID
jgi:hypothetical protein